MATYDGLGQRCQLRTSSQKEVMTGVYNSKLPSADSYRIALFSVSCARVLNRLK